MRLLLDTHIILWTLNDNPKLSNKAKDLIMDSKNEIYYSCASVWETTIKYMSKPDKIRVSGSKLSDFCREMGYLMLPICDKHIKALETLVYHNKELVHHDPFDRIMIAQAKSEGLKFVTHDSKITYYEEPCIIAV